MITGIQFTGTVPPRETFRWFSHSWPTNWHVVWSVVPTTISSGSPQVEWEVEIERASNQLLTYWVNVTNLADEEVAIEARYTILNVN